MELRVQLHLLHCLGYRVEDKRMGRLACDLRGNGDTYLEFVFDSDGGGCHCDSLFTPGPNVAQECYKMAIAICFMNVGISRKQLPVGNNSPGGVQKVFQ